MGTWALIVIYIYIYIERERERERESKMVRKNMVDQYLVFAWERVCASSSRVGYLSLISWSWKQSLAKFVLAISAKGLGFY